MKRIYLCLFLVAALLGSALAQTPEERAKRSEEIVAKTRKIDLLNQMLPLLLSKSQINDLLPAIEKARQNMDKTWRFEYDELKKLEPDLDATIAAGQEKGDLPKRDFVVKVTKTFRALSILRDAAVSENIAIVKIGVDKVFNAGQKKAATNLIDATFFDPSLKPEDLTDAKKMEMYIKVVLLDPLAYPVLIEMQKHAS